MRSRADRRFELALARIDDHMGAIVEHVRLASERTLERPPGTPAIEPTLDLGLLLERVAREAGARTSAAAAAVQVEGADGVSARGSFGEPPAHELLHGPLAASPELYRAVTIDWSHVGSEADDRRFASALVIPLSSDGSTRGALAAYALGSDAFRHDEVRALESLAVEAAPLVASACRLASVERRATLDEITGLRNEKSYEQELDREVARSRRTGRPFAVLVVELAVEQGQTETEDDCLWELAGLALEATRSTDVVFRRGERELALLLPETDADGAANVLARLQADLATRPFRLCAPTVRSANVAEWLSGESATSLDARVRHSGTRTTGEAAYRAVATPSLRAGGTPRAPDARDEFLARLARELRRAGARSQQLSLLLVEPDVRTAADGLPSIASARTILGDLAARLDDSLAGFTTCSRTGRNQLGVVLLGAAGEDAERHFLEVRDWLEAHAGVTLAAGASVLTAGDRAETLFGRAQHALWQAKQTGRSTIVISRAPGLSTP